MCVLHTNFIVISLLGANFFQGLGRKQNFDAAFGLELVQYMVQCILIAK